MIKDRIIQVLDYYHVPKEKFFKEIGVTSANFRGKAKETPVNSSIIENIFTHFPEINLDWLITGKGEMLRHEAPTTTTEPRNDTLAALVASFQATLAEKDKQIDHLLDIIHSLTSNKIQ